MDKIASVSRLKASLSAYLEMVKAGEQIIVTDRGKPIARVVPMGTATQGDDVETQGLIREGILRPGNGRSPLDVLGEMPVVARDAQALDALLEERENGW